MARAPAVAAAGRDAVAGLRRGARRRHRAARRAADRRRRAARPRRRLPARRLLQPARRRGPGPAGRRCGGAAAARRCRALVADDRAGTRAARGADASCSSSSASPTARRSGEARDDFRAQAVAVRAWVAHRAPEPYRSERRPRRHLEAGARPLPHLRPGARGRAARCACSSSPTSRRPAVQRDPDQRPNSVVAGPDNPALGTASPVSRRAAGLRRVARGPTQSRHRRDRPRRRTGEVVGHRVRARALRRAGGVVEDAGRRHRGDVVDEQRQRRRRGARPRSASSGRRSEQQRDRLLEQLADAREELRGVGAVEDAVVAGQRDVHRVAARRARRRGRPARGAMRADGEDRGLRRVDDRREARSRRTCRGSRP